MLVNLHQKMFCASVYPALSPYKFSGSSGALFLESSDHPAVFIFAGLIPNPARVCPKILIGLASCFLPARLLHLQHHRNRHRPLKSEPSPFFPVESNLFRRLLVNRAPSSSICGCRHPSSAFVLELDSPIGICPFLLNCYSFRACIDHRSIAPPYITLIFVLCGNLCN